MYMHFTNDAKQMKHEVLKRVAELAFSGELEEKKEQIPYDIIPTNVARFRCCVYKEREIIRERVNASMGKTANTGLISVLPAACEGCPINRYNVTANCQRCMAKKCVEACPFGAITITGKGAYIEPEKCRECGRCAQACPYNAISDTMRPCLRSCPVEAISMDNNRLAAIKYDRCINCGACTNDCPFGAITDSSNIVQIIELFKSTKKVYAIFAPAIEGQFGDASIGMIKAALRKLGFDEAVEVALGADAVATHEAHELAEAVESGRKMTTSCCPAFVNMIEKHFPKLIPLISGTASPMTATARYIKHHNPKAVVVFIGPCIAKKGEVERVADGADYAMTFEELMAMFSARNIDPIQFKEESQDGSVYGKGFAQSGGVSGAVRRVLEENGIEVPVSCVKCNGARECKKILAMLNAGKLPENMVEGMACEGGCIAGPGTIVLVRNAIKSRTKLLAQADKRTIQENFDDHRFSEIDLTR